MFFCIHSPSFTNLFIIHVMYSCSLKSLQMHGRASFLGCVAVGGMTEGCELPVSRHGVRRV